MKIALPLFLIGWFREHWTRQRSVLRPMAAAAYGAFIIHPPVIVSLALAFHQVPMAAELKLVLVFRRRGRRIIRDHRAGHPAAGARHGDRLGATTARGSAP